VSTAPNELFRALEELVAELPARLRSSRNRVGDQSLQTLRTLAREIGLVTRDEFDELELRVAQLEHRLRLLERDLDAGSSAPPPRPR
jgi:polyhydroxyalkanoate synthesis regulator phasin